MQINSATAAAPANPTEARKTDDPVKIRDAAQQFEALLIGQILKDVSASAGTCGFGEADASSSSMLEMANEQFARTIAARGGLGLAGMVCRDIAAKPPTVSTTAVEK